MKYGNCLRPDNSTAQWRCLRGESNARNFVHVAAEGRSPVGRGGEKGDGGAPQAWPCPEAEAAGRALTGQPRGRGSLCPWCATALHGTPVQQYYSVPPPRRVAHIRRELRTAQQDYPPQAAGWQLPARTRGRSHTGLHALAMWSEAAPPPCSEPSLNYKPPAYVVEVQEG